MSGVNPQGRGDQAGFTLIELLISFVIIAVITVPLGSVMFGYVRTTDETAARLSESRDLQIAAAYWAQDVASMGTRSTVSPFGINQSVETGAAFNGGLYKCGSLGTPIALVRFAWDDYGVPSAPVRVVVAYLVSNGGTELHRIVCRGSIAVVSDITLAHDLAPSTAPALVCSTTCTGTLLVPTPATATLTITLKDPKNLGAAWSVGLVGQRRQTS